MKMDKTDNTQQHRTIEKTAPNALLRASVITMVLLCAAAFVCGTASAATIWVPEGGNLTIQQAVNNATACDTITVRDGTYNENVDVNVAHLTIRSQNGSANCTVNAASSSDHVFDVSKDYVNISGFTVENATGSQKAGIYLGNSVDHCNISSNNVSGNNRGIYLYHSSNNTLTNNTASNNDDGIYLYHSCNNNTLTNNTASNNDDGIYLYLSSDNTLTNNTASNNDDGILLSSSSNNTLTNNTANSNTEHGIYLYNADDNNVSCNWVHDNTKAGFYLTDGSTGNTIEHNNIIANGAVQGNGSYQYQFYNSQTNSVDAKNNYWGAGMTDTLIAASINENPGNVTFLPKLDGPDPCAPIPELPTVLLFAVGLSLLAGYVRVGRRK